MKKLIYLFCLIYLFNINMVLAYTTTSNSVIENVDISIKKKKIFFNYNLDKVIDNEVNLVPDAFNIINDYYSIDKFDYFDVIIKINNSKYKYLDNSLKFMSDDIKRYGINNNYKKIGIKGGDGLDIYKEYYIYRSYNEALRELFNNKKISSISNKKLSGVLSKNGYKSLDEYYLKYFNKKYNKNYKNINEFPRKIVKKIFSGKLLKNFENNKYILKLGYDYFYKNVINIKYQNNKYNLYSDDFFNLKNNKIKFTIYKNKKYYTDCFKLYNIHGYLELRYINN